MTLKPLEHLKCLKKCIGVHEKEDSAISLFKKAVIIISLTPDWRSKSHNLTDQGNNGDQSSDQWCTILQKPLAGIGVIFNSRVMKSITKWKNVKEFAGKAVAYKTSSYYIADKEKTKGDLDIWADEMLLDILKKNI